MGAQETKAHCRRTKKKKQKQLFNGGGSNIQFNRQT